MNHATEWNSISPLLTGPWIEEWVNLVPNSAGENILPFKLIIIREKFLQKGLLGKFYKEKLENSQNYQGKVS